MTMEPENVTEETAGDRDRVAKEMGLEPDYVTDVAPGDDVADPDLEDADADSVALSADAAEDIDDGPLLDSDGPLPDSDGPLPDRDRPLPASDGPLLASAASLRESWQRIQAEFVDDPQASVREAAGIVSDLTETVVSTIQRREQRIRRSWEGNGSGVPGTGNTDTEQLRTTFRRYRAFFDQLTQL